MSISKQKKDILSRLVAKLETVAPYADALYSENHTRRLAKDNADTEFTAHADAGVKIRAFDGKQFHEISVQGWQPDLLQIETQKLATRLKDRTVDGKTIQLKILKEHADEEYTVAFEKDPRTVSMQEKANFITQLHKRVMATPGFVSCQVGYREEEEIRVFVSKTKKLASTWTGCTVSIVPFVKTQDGQTRNDFYTSFANGYEVTKLNETELKAFLTRTTHLKSAKRITPGKYTVILHPTVAGLLAHESFGHGMEADTIMHGRARAAEYLGKKISSVKVNICEDASLEKTHGFLFFDDEGVQPKRTFLVERGIVKQPITDLFSASKSNHSRTANGRAESFDHKTYARMTNTFFLPGPDDPQKMIKEVKDGLYLHSGSSGMEDPKGWGVQISGILCERIKNGKLTGELFYEASLSGFLPDLLGNIKAVGKNFEIIKDVGFCGKNHKEWVRVSSGGPHLLIEKVELS